MKVIDERRAMKKRMKKGRTEEQMSGVLSESDDEGRTAEICRRYGVSTATFYKSKVKFGGVQVSEAKRLKAR